MQATVENPAKMQTQLAEPDALLLRRLAETGDSQAFAEIIHRYAGVVFAASLRILRDEARAQDVSQETFFRLLRQPRLVSHSLGGWLHRSATHLAIDIKRSELSRRHRERNYWLQQEASRPIEPSWEEVSPYVDQALNEIPDPMRTLLVRHFLQGIPQAQLAAEMQLSPATISRKIKSGVDELQRHLRKRGVYVALAALAAFCTEHSAKAAPPGLLSELGKMQMAGPVRVGPVPGPNPPINWPPPLSTSGSVTLDGGAKIVAAFFAVMALVAIVAVATLCWQQRSVLFAAPKPQQQNGEARLPDRDSPAARPASVTH